MVIDSHSLIPAISIAPVRALRANISDLLVVKPDNSLLLLTHGLHEIPLSLRNPNAFGGVLSVKDGVETSVSLQFANKSTTRMTINLVPKDTLTHQALLLLSLSLPGDFFFAFHYRFLLKWSLKNYSCADNVTFMTFRDALLEELQLLESHVFSSLSAAQAGMKWQNLTSTSSFSRYDSDPALRKLKLPPMPKPPEKYRREYHDYAIIVLQEMHYLGLNLWLNVRRHKDLLMLSKLIMTLGVEVRPEWAEFWKRVCYDPVQEWPQPVEPPVHSPQGMNFLNRLPFWPPDALSTIYNRMNNPDWITPWPSTSKRASAFELTPSAALGAGEPLKDTRNLMLVYSALIDPRYDSRTRAEKAILSLNKVLGAKGGQQFIDNLPIGLAAPLKEATRACQLNPSADWPVDVFRLIGRNDLVESVNRGPDMMFDYGYKSIKEYLVSESIFPPCTE